ncbi:hypothetical protein MTR65_02290 [Novosphingobium sp. 2637]|uniref:Uncharacterized protein n=2 Tax=Novosphingobium mangrovi (ex Hu et al. 2023) TaxID=2930094 RepID=A0ABT0A8K1_9SPHN|nr:hypothetical protein [Novosphingobium mangrovi (ex Hu et al. 2023)]
MFADQFTADAEGALYRKSQKGAQYRVSEAEKEAFITAYCAHIRYANWSMIMAIVLLSVLVPWFNRGRDVSESMFAIRIGVYAIMVAFVVFYYWSWNAPARALRHRTPERAALTREQARGLVLSKITYRKLALVASIGMGLVLKHSQETDLFQSWALVWLAIGGALALGSGVQAFRKWRWGQHHSRQ